MHPAELKTLGNRSDQVREGIEYILTELLNKDEELTKLRAQLNRLSCMTDEELLTTGRRIIEDAL